MKFLLIATTVVSITMNYLRSDKQALDDFTIKYQESIKYKVYRIDSVNKYYVIYARKGHEVFKIVSPKVAGIKGKKIVENGEYKFQLHSYLLVDEKRIIPAPGMNELSGWRIDDSTTIKFEGDSIRDLYIAENLKGLYLIRKKK